MIEKLNRLLASKDVHLQELIRGATVALILKVIAGGLQFLLSVTVSRQLGAEGSGLFFLALTLVSFIAIIGTIGLDRAGLRFIAANAEEEYWSRVKGIHQNCLKLTGTASLILSLTVITFAPQLADRVFSKPNLADLLYIMGAAILPLTLALLHSELLRGLKRIRDALLINGVAIPALTLVGVVLLAPILGVEGAAIAYSAAVFGTLVMGYGLWRFAISPLKQVMPHFEINQLMSTATPLFVMTLFQQFILRSPTLLLGSISDSEDVGIFEVARRTVQLMGFILTAVNSIAAPKFAALYAKQDIDTMARLAQNASAIMTILAAPMLGVCFFVPELIMSIFGDKFTTGAAILPILALGQFINVSTGSVAYILMMTGNEHSIRNTIILCSAIIFTLSVIFIPLFGPLGAAIATSVTLVAQNIIATLIVYRKFGFWSIDITAPLR